MLYQHVGLVLAGPSDLQSEEVLLSFSVLEVPVFSANWLFPLIRNHRTLLGLVPSDTTSTQRLFNTGGLTEKIELE